MKGQTTIEPCAFCGEPSTEQIEVVPADIDTATLTVRKAAILRWLCPHHAEAVKGDRGWQDRAAKARSKRRKAMKQAQEEATLFDPGRKRSYEDAA